MSHDDTQVRFLPARDLKPSGWDLVDLHGQRWPLVYPEVFVGNGFPNDLQFTGLPPRAARLDCSGPAPRLEPLDPSLDVRVQGKVCQGPVALQEGDEIRLESLRFQLAPTAVSAILEGLAPPNMGRQWALGEEPVLLGRPGKRDNHVVVEHPSISRQHATLAKGDDGCFHLIAESPSATLVGGKPTQGQALKDGDLIQLGELMFRFRTLHRPGLRIHSLGPFEVELLGERVSEKAWKGHTARFVLAYVAAAWGHPVPVEALLEDFWPELSAEKARNNLNSAVSTLRGALGEGERLVRTHQTVELKLEPGDWHDLQELRRCLEPTGNPEQQARRQRQALELYRAPYLEGCFMDWALRRREELERELVAAALGLAAWESSHRRDEQAVWASTRALLLDPCCQEAYLMGMQAYRSLGRPEEAVRLFESCKATLKKELDMEPTLELLREHQFALLSLG